MIKVTYVIDVLDTPMAGTESQLIRMINGLDASRFQVGLVCLRPHAWLAQNAASLRCSQHTIDIRYFRRLSTYLNIVRLAHYFRADRPDVVHTFFPVANVVAVIAARLAGVHAVISSRRDYGEWMSRRYLALTRFANRFAARIVTNSARVKALTVEREGVAPDKIDVIANGIDFAAFARLQPDLVLKRDLSIPESSRVVGIVANFRPMKRHETFVRAAAQVLQTRHDVHFLLVGGTANTLARKQAMETLACTLGIGDRLHFVGAQPDVKRYLSIMDVGVNCSEGEGLSNAVMEYMAAGVPAVVARSGGNPDLITDGVDGLMFALDDHAALAQHVNRLLTDEAERRRFAAQARAKIEREMSTDVMLNQYAALYAKMTTC